MTKEPTAFELLADELRRSLGLSQAQQEALERVLTGFGGHQVYIPDASTQRVEQARRTARALVLQRLQTRVIRDRLVSMGVSRTTAYTLIADARAVPAEQAQ